MVDSIRSVNSNESTCILGCSCNGLAGNNQELGAGGRFDLSFPTWEMGLCNGLQDRFCY